MVPNRRVRAKSAQVSRALWCAISALVLSAAVLIAAPENEMNQKVDALVARMTIDEKIGQMSQSTAMNTLTETIKQEIRQGRWGSFLNAGSPADRAQAQQIARRES